MDTKSSTTPGARERFVTFRIPPELHERLRELATRRDRSVSAELRRIIRREVEEEDSA
jgi:predicted DNA-binding protein